MPLTKPPPNPQAYSPAIMSILDIQTQTRLRALPLDNTLLEITPEEEAFFKSETGIQDTEELKKHIIQVQEDAYKVSRCSRTDRTKSTPGSNIAFHVRFTHILAFGGSDSRGSGSPRCLHIHASSNWGRAGRMRCLWTLDAAVRISSFSAFRLL